MAPQGMMLSEISQTEKEKYRMISRDVESKKKKKSSIQLVDIKNGLQKVSRTRGREWEK